MSDKEDYYYTAMEYLKRQRIKRKAEEFPSSWFKREAERLKRMEEKDWHDVDTRLAQTISADNIGE